MTKNYRDREIMSGQGRAEVGCTMTFLNDSGERLTLTASGMRGLKPTIVALCDEALARDETFRVVSYSTPQTIFTDLRGARIQHETGLIEKHSGTTKAQLSLPEVLVLTKVGRRHLLHPSIERYTAPKAA